MDRRQFVALGAGLPMAAARENPRIGFVRSSHSRLLKPSSPEDPLDEERVRDMVWKAIEYAGGMEGPIQPGSWVVIKPNVCFLKPQPSYCPGDVADLRVVKAVLEYVASRTQAGRVTFAEGGSYRGLRDKVNDNTATQNGARVDLTNYDWGGEEFPGFSGSVGSMLRSAGDRFPGKRFDYIDLNYDAVKDAAGRLARREVPRSANGVKAFGPRPDYHVTNTITRCDFLVTIPVLKVHAMCGVTGCLKNYVGTAPREAYSVPGRFWNVKLHEQHALDNRIDPMIVDLAAFHPPDFSVVDAIRGLQYSEHRNGRQDQTVRHNLVFAGADPVACDAIGAHLAGFNPWDIDFLHLAQERGMGSMDPSRADVAGDDVDGLRSRWGKPRDWYGRCNREWLVSDDPAAPLAAWKRNRSRTDTLKLRAGQPPGTSAAAVRVIAGGARKGYLWVGLRGKVEASLNGQKVMEEESVTRYRVGQFRRAIDLNSGENLLSFRVRSDNTPALLSVLITGPRNDGDTLDGIRWST